jgi:rSAM/selenodomain-associated transferase 2
MRTVSLIIPTLNEEDLIHPLLEGLQKQSPDELVVADGFSSDGTVAMAQKVDHVILAPLARGRALQMNMGAEVAKGDVLLFLHADSQLPPEGICHIRDAFKDPRVIGGRFRVRFDRRGLKYRITAFYTRFPFFSYGDQGFFVKRKTFMKMRGFNPDVAFEDIDFFRRLRREGKTRILPFDVITSSRRFEKQGFWRQKLINFALSLLYYIGMSPQPLLRRWYPPIR